MKIEIKHKLTSEVLFSCEADSLKIAVELAVKAGANLKGANLKGAYLEWANLKGANLKGAYLKGANLKGAYLEWANLEWAHLERADLVGAHLVGAHLVGANLVGAYLEEANLEEANLEGANLVGANLDYTAIPMWCGSFGVKVDFRIVCQMLLHVFAVDCYDKRFLLVKKAIQKYAKLSDKWHYLERKLKEKP